ncbi:endonuclease/exonuclease/phosphatase family protein [Streptomyces uncialis]|uniref:endonuclease/exonuclease/phosphatase family protein n=1 Tax=Streptomyces uncialis TaxID=1048205 RepID=UPI002E2FE639|nr:endonuclease/exonuclease/phosphatase family protein [Streptomyces uncialis]
MHRFLRSLAALCAAMVGFQMFLAPPASATEVSEDAAAIAKSAGQKWALKSLANGMYVSVGLNDAGAQEWRMRAMTGTAPGSWERFTLHTNHAAKTVGFRSEITGFFATAEFSDPGDQKGKLRARGVRLGHWQQFTPGYTAEAPPAGSPAGSVVLTLRASEKAADDPTATPEQRALKYVSANADPGGDGLLRARADSAGSWEKFVLEPVVGAISADPPTAGAAPASGLDVMSWNMCANNKNCTKWSGGLAGYEELNTELKGRLANSASGHLPDVVFLQEFCEKHAKRVELMLEQPVTQGGTGVQWDVRFAPLHHRTNGPLIQKQCQITDTGGNTVADRGSYGVAIAVPEENVWYERHDLPSPDGKEQRTAICAAVPSRAVMACNAHFSSGGGDNSDDQSGAARTKQAAALLGIVGQYEQKGYRVVFGGDLNSVPTDSMSSDTPKDILTQTYTRYRECDEGYWAARPFDGRATKPFDTRSIKIDYIFAPDSAPIDACMVTPDAGKSDHYPIHGRVNLPAT